ncbi:MAG: hypothetical protein NVSMB12_19570 [Acidimicrobiales bacterium]
MNGHVGTRTLLAAAAVVIVAPFGSAPAIAVSPVTQLQSGSWWQVQPTGGQLPPPPNVPTKGLWVDSAPNGNAISAVRFTLTGATAPVLHLRVHPPAPAAGAAIQACVTASAWRPVTAGPWAARPHADCAHGSAPTQLNGTVLTVDLSGLSASGGAYDLVLEPIPSPPPPAPPQQPFDVTFEEPVPSDIAASPAAADTSATLAAPVDGSAAESPAPAQDSAPVAAITAPSGAPLGGDLGAALPSGVVSPPTPAAPAPPTARVTRPPTVVSRRPRLAAAKIPGHLSRRTRYLLTLILADVAGWMYLRSPIGAALAPRFTLYDDPTDASVAAAPVRRERAPSLR